MIRKLHSPLSGHVRIVFELPSCLWADRIHLVGDFNQWNEQATPMQQERDGVWRAMIDLKWGAYCEFRYLIDGQWRTDYHADGQTRNEFGAENSIVHATASGEMHAPASMRDEIPDLTQRQSKQLNDQLPPSTVAKFQPRTRTASPVLVAA